MNALDRTKYCVFPGTRLRAACLRSSRRKSGETVAVLLPQRRRFSWQLRAGGGRARRGSNSEGEASGKCSMPVGLAAELSYVKSCDEYASRHGGWRPPVSNLKQPNSPKCVVLPPSPPAFVIWRPEVAAVVPDPPVRLPPFLCPLRQPAPMLLTSWQTDPIGPQGSHLDWQP
jgi:hypothetical protein